MILTRCSCNHLDIEHKLLLSPDYLPTGAGMCTVCGEEVCPRFSDSDADKTAKAAIAQREQRDSALCNSAQQALIQRMIDDPEFQNQLNLRILLSRIEFNTEYLEVLGQEGDMESVLLTLTQLINDYKAVGNLGNDSESKQDAKLRRTAYRALRLARLMVRFTIWRRGLRKT